ncbi:MAG: histidine kinase dimerization/phospho-acceptor domain-containing protein [Anaeromyxobacteraceae bacterium]
MVTAILDDGLGAFGAAAGVVTLLDPQDGRHLRAVGWRGYPDAQVRPYERLPITAPFPITAAAALREAQWLGTEAERAAAYPGWDRSQLLHAAAWACLPLLVEDRCLGVVGLTFREEQSFPADVRDEMLSHVRKCAQALERVQLDEALARERAHLSAILDALPAGVSVADASGRVIIVNATAIAQAGPGEQLLGRSALAAVPVGATHPDGRPVLAAELPLARALAGERVEREEVRVPVPGGRIRTLSLSAAPLHDGGGAISGAVEAAWDVTTQKETEGALRTATVALDVANRQKDQFLAMLAHELRNPLAAIRSAAHVIRGRAAVGRDSSRAVGILERQAGNASRILDDLLDVSRITRGLVELRKERVRLDDVVASAVESQRDLADSLGHRLSVQLAPGLELDGDPTRLEQIVANLLNNAVKYSPPGGSIAVDLAGEGGRAVLRVSDRGSGIPPELLPRVFELLRAGREGARPHLGRPRPRAHAREAPRGAARRRGLRPLRGDRPRQHVRGEAAARGAGADTSPAPPPAAHRDPSRARRRGQRGRRRDARGGAEAPRPRGALGARRPGGARARGPVRAGRGAARHRPARDGRLRGRAAPEGQRAGRRAPDRRGVGLRTARGPGAGPSRGLRPAPHEARRAHLARARRRPGAGAARAAVSLGSGGPGTGPARAHPGSRGPDSRPGWVAKALRETGLPAHTPPDVKTSIIPRGARRKGPEARSGYHAAGPWRSW